MTEYEELCKFLDWDSKFFGFRIAQVLDNRLDQEKVNLIFNWCNLNNINCLYFLSDFNHKETIRLAEDNGFRFVDIRMTFEKQLTENDTFNKQTQLLKGIIRTNKEDDVTALRVIAKENHRDSRFYYDQNFPLSVCDSLYETWIENSCKGYADVVLVSKIEGHIAGYITCHLLKDGKGQIGLMGVSSEFRGKSIGQALVIESLGWFAQKGISQVMVVTQGRNINAQRLYQRCGFLIESVQLWYHKWFPKEEKSIT